MLIRAGAAALIAALIVAGPASAALAVRPDRAEDRVSSSGRGSQNQMQKLPPTDTRQGSVRTQEQGTGFRPPADRRRWEGRARELREQILVAAGLWPMPPRTDLQPRVYGRLIRDGYTVEKVVLRTLPGLYLTGNLYRPTRADGRVPGVLSPHGHWSRGRFEEVVQARGAGLARLGCVVFSYDMIGFGDSKPIGHSFRDARMDRLGISLLGLQLWNSIRALDFLSSLPDVDARRIGCTGASGGGTQTFLLTAADDRVKVSAPVCMVSAGFQGGCECENCPSLRIDTDNVEIAAAAAPRQQILVGATGDWTKAIVEHGFPEIQATYRLLGYPDQVSVERFEAGHNYNQQSREAVYRWFAHQLLRQPEAPGIREAPFTPEPEAALSCYDAEHPRPADELDAAELKQSLARTTVEQAESLAPRSRNQWQTARREIQVGLRHRLAARVPAAELLTESASDGRLYLGRRGAGDRVPALLLRPIGSARNRGTLVVTPDGLAAAADGQHAALVSALRRRGHAVLLIEVLGSTADSPSRSERTDFFTTYNRTLLAERVQDVLTGLSFLRNQPGIRSVNLVGEGRLGPVCLLARSLDAKVARAAIDADAFEYRIDADEPPDRLLPGVLRFGGLRAAAALAVPGDLLLHHTGDALDPSWARRAYELWKQPDALQTTPARLASKDVVAWLTERETSRG